MPAHLVLLLLAVLPCRILTCHNGQFRSQDLPSLAGQLLPLLDPSPRLLMAPNPWPLPQGPGVCGGGGASRGTHGSQPQEEELHPGGDPGEVQQSGGKLYDIEYQGVSQALGAMFGESNYLDNLVPLATEYGLEETVKLPTVYTILYHILYILCFLMSLIILCLHR